MNPGIKVEQIGMVVKVVKPWLACSPDGYFIDSDGNPAILEIKCPYTNREQPKIKENWINQERKMNLKNSIGRKYYMQVQLTMYVTNAKNCHFMVYTEKDQLIDVIPFDEKYV